MTAFKSTRSRGTAQNQGTVHRRACRRVTRQAENYSDSDASACCSLITWTWLNSRILTAPVSVVHRFRILVVGKSILYKLLQHSAKPQSSRCYSQGGAPGSHRLSMLLSGWRCRGVFCDNFCPISLPISYSRQFNVSSSKTRLRPQKPPTSSSRFIRRITMFTSALDLNSTMPRTCELSGLHFNPH
jgi:hypothetical protein